MQCNKTTIELESDRELAIYAASHVSILIRRDLKTIIKEACAILDYHEYEVESLLNDALHFLDNISLLLDAMDRRLADDNKWLLKMKSGAYLVDKPFGKILLTIPSNAPIPLALILPIALIASGNSVIVSSSNKVCHLTSRLIGYLSPLVSDRITEWHDGTRAAFSKLVENQEVDAVYFLGSSSYLPSIAEQCARNGVHLIYEGQGSTVSVVDASADISFAAELLVASKVHWNGWMCSAPNTIAVEDSIFDTFVELLKMNAAKHPLRRELSGLISSDVIDQISNIARMNNASPPDFNETKVQLLFIDSLSSTWETEIFGPMAFITRFNSSDNLVNQLRKSPYKLQLTIFSHNKSHIEKFIKHTQFARYCVNKLPTSQNTLLPWGGYGLSGVSPVTDLVQKGTRRSIVEY